MVKSWKNMICLLLTMMMIFGMFSFIPKAEPVVDAAEISVEQIGATKYPPATTKTSNYTTKYYPACDKSYTTLNDALDSLEINSDKNHRTKIAVFNGMLDYTLTPEQNNELLALLKAGLLLNPDYTGSSSTTATTKATTAPTTQGTTKYAPATTKSSDHTTKYYPACDKSYTTLNDALESLKINTDKSHRTKIAVFNGMTAYQLTPEENNELLALLKAGLLLNPDYTGSSSTTATTKATTAPTTQGTTKYAPATTKSSDHTTKYYPACDKSYTTLNDALESLKINTDKSHRTKIAVFNGMTAYQLTPEENNELLALLKAGLLLNPDYTGSSSTTATESSETTVVTPATSVSSNYTTKYYPAYTGSETSLANALSEWGIQSSKSHRLKIALYNGMTDYEFTPEQNSQLLAMLKEGSLLNPDYTGGSTDPAESDPVATEVKPATSVSSSYTTKYYPAYTGTSKSLTEALTSLSIQSSKAHRLKIALFNGMNDYAFTPEQNTELLNMLKAGTLLNPDFKQTIVYYPKYTGSETSIVSALDSLKIDSSKDHRMKIALANGMTDYAYTPEQNTELLKLLKAGKLIDPDKSNISVDVPSATTATSATGSAGAGSGYDSAYEGGMAGTGKIYAHGIDVSKWNEKDGDYSDVDFSFAKAKAAGMDYVIIRAGSTNALEDPMFDKYYDAARAAGMDIGAYFYSYAMTASEAKSDANKFLSYIKGKTFEYPCYLDFEEASQRDNLTKAQKTTVCMTFMDIIADAGYMTGVYTGKSMSGGMDLNTICEKYELWIAHYPTSNSYKTYGAEGSTYSKSYGMYQYTSQKTISGISGVMDANVCYKDYPSLIKKYGFNGYASGGWKTTSSGSRYYLYNDGSRATGWFVDGFNTYYLDPSNSGYAYTGWKRVATEGYYFSSSGVLSQSLGKIGDADCSGSIGISDVTYLQKVGVSATTSESKNELMGDVTGDGVLSIRDATQIQLYLARKISTFPVCK